MGGNWSDNPLPIRPGGYINFESSGSTPVQPGDFGRVGLPIRATWGPVNQFVDIVTDADRVAAFGNVDGDPTDANDTSWMIREAIIGGAELVKAYRVAGAGGAAGTIDLDDWLAQPTLTLDAKYVGTRGNFDINISASAIFPGRSVLTISDAGNPTPLEQFTYDEDDVAALAADINANSAYVDATLTFDPEVSEVVELASTVTPPTSGFFALTVDLGDGSAPVTTADIAHTANAATVQAALEALTGVGVGQVTVATTAAGPGLDVASTIHEITFGGTLANQNVSVSFGTPVGAALDNPLTLTVTQGGGRSPLEYGSFTMAGGTNPAAPALVDYTNAMTAFEAEGGFDLFALDGVSEEDFVGINAALKVWADTNNAAGRYVMVVVGGGDTELATADVTGALARTSLFDTEWVVNIGVSGLAVTTPANNVINLNSAQSAPRLAGMIAASGITGSVTFGEVVGAGVNGPVTPTQIETLIQQGVVVFARRGDVTRVEDGITTFISLTEEKDFTFTQIRAVRAIQQIGLDVSEIVERDWIGKKVNTTTVRDSLIARLQTYFGTLEAQRVLVNGTEVSIDTRYDSTTTNVFVLVLAQFQFELKRVLLTVRVPTVS